jgi:hypothetical protein
MSSFGDGASPAHRATLTAQHVDGSPHRLGLHLEDSPEPENGQNNHSSIAPSAAAAAQLQQGHDATAPQAADASGTTPSAQQQADEYLRAEAAFLLNGAHTSSYDSAGTGHLHAAMHQQAAGSPRRSYQAKQNGQRNGFVPRKDSNDNIPCFVQTSALFTNVSMLSAAKGSGSGLGAGLCTQRLLIEFAVPDHGI